VSFRYVDAHKVQANVAQMEQDEQEKHLANRSKKIISAEATLMNKQQNELKALIKKNQAIEDGQLKMRDVEHNKLLQRYQNVRKELENQQSIERNRMDKMFRPGTANRSNISMMGGSPSKKSLNSSRMSMRGNQPASKPSK
jgi:hypothetical protein